jgi:hypothetical protein
VDVYIYLGFVMFGCVHLWVFNVWICVCVGFIICGCVYVGYEMCEYVVFVMCGFCNVWVCV